METVRSLRPRPGTGPDHPELWFERIDVDQHRSFRPLVTVPHGGDRQLTEISDRADRLLQLPLTSVVLASSVATMARGLRNPGKMLDTWSFYARPEILADPSRFFEEPPEHVHPARRDVGWTTFRPRGGQVDDFFFASPFEPVNPVLRRPYLSNAENRVSHLRLWRHGDRPRPVALCVHGMMAAYKTVNTELFNVRWLFERGMDVALFDLPRHGGRAAGFVDGFGFPNLDVATLAESWAHAVYDLRMWLSWLFGQGAPEVGCMGVSLGGYMTSLIAGLDDRLAFAVPMIPATSLGDCAYDWFPARYLLQAFFTRLGWTIEDMRLHTAVHTPLQHPSLLPAERMLIIGADGDHVTPPYQARLLWEHWNGPQVHWYAGSHVMHLHRGTYMRQLGRFLGGLGMFS